MIRSVSASRFSDTALKSALGNACMASFSSISGKVRVTTGGAWQCALYSRDSITAFTISPANFASGLSGTNNMILCTTNSASWAKFRSKTAVVNSSADVSRICSLSSHGISVRAQKPRCNSRSGLSKPSAVLSGPLSSRNPLTFRARSSNSPLRERSDDRILLGASSAEVPTVTKSRFLIHFSRSLLGLESRHVLPHPHARPRSHLQPQPRFEVGRQFRQLAHCRQATENSVHLHAPVLPPAHSIPFVRSEERRVGK